MRVGFILKEGVLEGSGDKVKKVWNILQVLGATKGKTTSKCHWERRNVQLVHDPAFPLRFLFSTYWQSCLGLNLYIDVYDITQAYVTIKVELSKYEVILQHFSRQTLLSHFCTRVHPHSVMVGRKMASAACLRAPLSSLDFIQTLLRV